MEILFVLNTSLLFSQHFPRPYMTCSPLAILYDAIYLSILNESIMSFSHCLSFKCTSCFKGKIMDR